MRAFVDSDNFIYVADVRDPVTSEYYNDAVVTAIVLKADGTTLATVGTFTNQAGPLTINGTNYTDGIFRGQLASSAGMVDGTKTYKLKVTITFVVTVVIETCLEAGYLGAVNE